MVHSSPDKRIFYPLQAELYILQIFRNKIAVNTTTLSVERYRSPQKTYRIEDPKLVNPNETTTKNT